MSRPPAPEPSHAFAKAEPKEMAVRVKPLVWEDARQFGPWGELAKTPFPMSCYRIGQDGFASNTFGWGVDDLSEDDLERGLEDIEDARKAAQTDYERRILACVEAVPVPQVRDAAITEAAHLVPRYFGVWSATGVHVGVWNDGATAVKVLEEYPGGVMRDLIDAKDILAETGGRDDD